MRDTNMVLNLKNGARIEVIFPQRVLREYETPWLDGHEGSREMNIDVVETLKGDARKMRFLVAESVYAVKGYNTPDGVLEIIPVSEVSHISKLSDEKLAIGQERIAEFKRAYYKQQKEDPFRSATMQDLYDLKAELEKKIAELSNN